MKPRRRDFILEYLLSISDFVSGEELGKIAKCTPQNVSYHIEKLRKNGADIEVSHRGYRFIRENEEILRKLKRKFNNIGILFEYIRSCINLNNINSPQERVCIYYTYNEVDFFCKNSYGNISFIIHRYSKGELLPLVTKFFSEYLIGDVSILSADRCNYLVYNSYIFGRHTDVKNKEHFQIVLNKCQSTEVDKYKIMPLSNIRGDYIGTKGFSILIFEFLYANLCEVLV